MVVAMLAVLVLFGLFVVVRAYQIGLLGGAITGGLGIDSAQGLNRNETYRFVSRERIDRVRSATEQSLEDIRLLSDDHPVMLQNLILIEQAVEEADRSIASADYDIALERLEGVQRRVADFRTLVTEKQEAGKTYDEFLNLMETGEAIQRHAPYDFESAIATGNEGRAMMDSGDFSGGLRMFRRASKMMNDLDTRVDAVMLEKELKAKHAMSLGDGESAARLFEGILEIKPDYEPARIGLNRAANVGQVVALLGAAKENEGRDKLEEALQGYEQAYSLDSLSARAQQGAARVKRTIEEQKYDGFMSRAADAEEAGKWDLAISAYEEAKEAFPEREEIQEALENAKELKWQMELDAAMAKAVVAEKAREWDAARRAYQEVLDLDEENPEAIDGLFRSGKMIRALLRYESSLENAHEYAQKGFFQKGIRAFNDAMAIKPSYLPLDVATKRLRDLLKVQSQPVRLTIVSDERTWVSISGFKLLGKINQKTVNILPGNYKIRGRRKGYRDVVINLRIRQGMPLSPITVICAERI